MGKAKTVQSPLLIHEREEFNAEVKKVGFFSWVMKAEYKLCSHLDIVTAEIYDPFPGKIVMIYNQGHHPHLVNNLKSSVEMFTPSYQ